LAFYFCLLLGLFVLLFLPFAFLLGGLETLKLGDSVLFGLVNCGYAILFCLLLSEALSDLAGHLGLGGGTLLLFIGPLFLGLLFLFLLGLACTGVIVGVKKTGILQSLISGAQLLLFLRLFIVGCGRRDHGGIGSSLVFFNGWRRS